MGRGRGGGRQGGVDLGAGGGQLVAGLRRHVEGGALDEEVQRHDRADGVDGARQVDAGQHDGGARDGLDGRRGGGEVAAGAPPRSQTTTTHADRAQRVCKGRAPVHEADLVAVARGAQHVEEVSGEEAVHALEQAEPGRGGAEGATRDGDHRARETQAACEHGHGVDGRA